MNPTRLSFRALLSAIALWSVSSFATAEDSPWIPLFNGKDLSGWTVKIAKHPLGENTKDTYRVENGILKAEYDQYEAFDMQFGHLYSNQSYSHYVLRMEYKLLPATPLPDAPSWTELNSGVMLHSQSPLTLTLGQSFPVSIEGQFLAQGTSAGTQNGNVVTPGTHIHYQDSFTDAHIVNASAPLPKVDQWVAFEAEVRGHKEIIYRVDGDEVLRFNRPVLDSSDPDAQRLLQLGANPKLDHGHIALQAEGHPVWFRNIEIKPLEN